MKMEFGTANLREIVQVAAWLVALVLAIAKLRMRQRKRAVLKHDPSVPRSQALIALQSVVLAGLFVLLALLFLGGGVAFLLTPEPILPENRMAQAIGAYTSIAAALVTIVGLGLDLWLVQGHIDDALDEDLGIASRTRSRDMARAHQEGVEEGEERGQ